MKNLKQLLLVLILFTSLFATAQEENPSTAAQKEESIDASKPTNFYSFLDNTLRIFKPEKSECFWL